MKMFYSAKVTSVAVLTVVGTTSGFWNATSTI